LIDWLTQFDISPATRAQMPKVIPRHPQQTLPQPAPIRGSLEMGVPQN